MTQQIIVGAIVALAAVYAIWRWMPASWRRSAAGRVATGARQAGWVDAGRADALAARLSETSGCGACKSCSGCGTGAAAGPAGADGSSAHPVITANTANTTSTARR